jgi:hypothetical protein
MRSMGGMRLGLLGGFGASLVVVLGGCGGRTSTLDPDATVMVDANGPSGGTSAIPGIGVGAKAGTGATGGTTSSGKAMPTPGTAGVPAGGTSGVGASGGSAGMAPSSGASTGTGASAGIDPWALSNCIDYCNTSAPAQPCTSGLSSAKCAASCMTELASVDLACQKVAGSLLQCLTIVYENSRNCGDVQQFSAAKCSNLFSSYEQCAGNLPVPPPPPPPTTCSGTGSNGGGKCSMEMTCQNGARYRASCYEAGPNQTNCFCEATLADGSATAKGFGLNENAFDACQDTFAMCGFPQF